MFKYELIQYLRASKSGVFIKYYGEEEQFLTSGKIDLEDFMRTQKSFLTTKEEMRKRSEGWEQRHQRGLYFKSLDKIKLTDYD